MRQLSNTGGICYGNMGCQGEMPMVSQSHHLAWRGPQSQVKGMGMKVMNNSDFKAFRNNFVRSGNRKFYLNPNASEFVPSFTPQESNQVNGTCNTRLTAVGLDSMAVTFPIHGGRFPQWPGMNCQFDVANGNYPQFLPMYQGGVSNGNGPYYDVHEEVEHNSNELDDEFSDSQPIEEDDVNVEMLSAVPINCFPVYGIIGYQCSVPKTPSQTQGQQQILLKVTPTPSSSNSAVQASDTPSTNQTPLIPLMPMQFSVPQADAGEQFSAPQIPRRLPFVPIPTMQQLQQQAPPLPDVTPNCQTSPISSSEAGNFITVFIPSDAFGTNQKGFNPSMLPPAI